MRSIERLITRIRKIKQKFGIFQNVAYKITFRVVRVDRTSPAIHSHSAWKSSNAMSHHSRTIHANHHRAALMQNVTMPSAHA